MTDTDNTTDETTDETSAETSPVTDDRPEAEPVEEDLAGDGTGDDAGDDAEEAGSEDAPAGGSNRTRALELEGEVAADYLEALLDIVDLDGDLDLDVEGDRAVVAVVGTGLDRLVGPQGATLEALQELTRLAVLTKTGNRSRLMLDVGGFRARRREELTVMGTAAAQRVSSSGEAEKLAPMTPFERKVVHDAVAAVEGVHSESEGEEPQRRVVVLPG